jgi:IclR family pca regulon transcriptional regulator
LSVLRAFDREHSQMTLTEVAERVDMTRAGARRYLLTLVHLGYVEQDGRKFRLTARVLELGYAFMSTMGLAEIAQPYLDGVAREAGETTAIAILDDFEVVHLARATVHRELAPVITIGRRFNALYNSTGRVLVAFMDEEAMESFVRDCQLTKPTAWSITSRARLLQELRQVRKQGYAIVDQESEPGLRSVAVPIFNKRGAVIAALNILTNVAAVSLEDLEHKMLPVLQRAALKIASAVVSE